MYFCVRAVRRLGRLHGPDRSTVQTPGTEHGSPVTEYGVRPVVQHGRDREYGVPVTSTAGSVLAIQQRQNRPDGRGADRQQRQHVRPACRTARGGRRLTVVVNGATAAAATTTAAIAVVVVGHRRGVRFRVEQHDQPEQVRARLFQRPDGPVPTHQETAFTVSIPIYRLYIINRGGFRNGGGGLDKKSSYVIIYNN